MLLTPPMVPISVTASTRAVRRVFILAKAVKVRDMILLHRLIVFANTSIRGMVTVWSCYFIVCVIIHIASRQPETPGSDGTRSKPGFVRFWSLSPWVLTAA